jgi:hypothetical protein
MSRLAGFALALILAIAAGVSADASAQEQKCTTAVANAANPGCGDAYRGMILYGQVPAPGISYTWSCNQCHSDNPLTDTLNTPAPAPSLIRAAPRDPGYIQFMMYKQPEAAPIMLAMESCCIGDRPPNNVMGDLGDIAEFLYTCKMGIAPCVTGGGGGGGGGTTPGELEGSGSTAFGNKAVGTASAPLTLKLTNVGSATVNVSGVTNSNATDFTVNASTCTTLSQATYCSVNVAFHPTTAGAHSATVTVASDGIFSPQSFTFTGTGVAGVVTHEGIWWNPSEDGWGINLEHQGDTIFATWFTYDTSGEARWLVMIASGAGNVYSGKIYTTTGSSYLASAFSKGTPSEAGSGALTFADAGHATFEYTVNGKHQTKSIVPQQFGTLPTCTYTATANLAGATNYQGLWWNSSEDGWGINFAHQGSIIFASWFTFDVDSTPLWLVSIMQKETSGETFSGDLLRMTATPFNAIPFKKNGPTNVGKATLAFANGNSATFQYTIGTNGTITKQLTHQPLTAGGTVCN